MVESIAHVEWIQRNVFDIRGSSTGSEEIGKHPKKQKREAYKLRIFAMIALEQRRLERTRNVQANTST